MYPPFPMDPRRDHGREISAVSARQRAHQHRYRGHAFTGIGFSGGFVAILINAQCIGFSIYLLLLSVRHPLYKRAKGADRPDRRPRGPFSSDRASATCSFPL